MTTFDIKQVQERLKISERTIFRLIKKGDLRGYKAGRAWRFEEEDISNFIAQQRARALSIVVRPAEAAQQESPESK